LTRDQFNIELSSDTSKATIGGVVDSKLATKNYLTRDQFNIELSSDTSKAVIRDVVVEVGVGDSLNADESNKIWKKSDVRTCT